MPGLVGLAAGYRAAVSLNLRRGVGAGELFGGRGGPDGPTTRAWSPANQRFKSFADGVLIDQLMRYL